MAKHAARADSVPPTNQAPRCAYGQSLVDFGRLSRAERKLLDGSRRGAFSFIDGERPAKATGANRVRASFVRFLVLGGDENAPVHEHGVQLYGAWLSGLLDLQGAKAEHRLVLGNCRIQRIEAHHASLKFLSLSGSRLMRGLAADGLCCEGDLFMRRDFHVTGEVRLPGATITGDLACTGGCFEGGDQAAMNCDGTKVGGGVFLDDGFRAKGEVRLAGMTIGGDVTCSGGRFENGEGFALLAQGVIVSGSVFLNKGFHATGTVSLLSARIGGTLDCGKGSFEKANGDALLCDSAHVTRGLLFRSVKKVDGNIDLSAMHVGNLADDADSWEGARGKLVLEGFTYGRIANAPTAAKARIAWLKLQKPAHLKDEFRPQPWEQLISVLRTMGHPEEARAIAVAKHEQLREANRFVGGSRAWDWVYGTLVGYGYRPWNLLRIAFWVWLACTLAYWAAVNPTAVRSGAYLLGPPKFEPSASCLIQRAVARSSLPCPSQVARYQDFFAPIYSLEVMLPVISLGGKERWQPVVSDQQNRPLFWGHALRVIYWLQTAFGWLAGLLLVGVVGTLIKRD